MKSKTKSKGPRTIGFVAAAHPRDGGDGQTVMPAFQPSFRAATGLDGNEVITYELNSDAFSQERAALAKRYRDLKLVLQYKRNMKRKRWRSEKKQFLERLIRSLRVKDLDKRRIKYTFATISVDRRFVGDPLREIEVRDSTKKVVHLALTSHREIFKLLKVGKYTLNTRFRPGRVKDNTHGDNVPRDANAICEYEWPGPGTWRVGWIRYETKFRRLTATEMRAIRRGRKNGYSLIQREMGYRAWLETHPYPEVSNDRELADLTAKVKEAGNRLQNLIEFHIGCHTKFQSSGQTSCWLRFSKLTDPRRFLPAAGKFNPGLDFFNPGADRAGPDQCGYILLPDSEMTEAVGARTMLYRAAEPYYNTRSRSWAVPAVKLGMVPCASLIEDRSSFSMELSVASSAPQDLLMAWRAGINQLSVSDPTNPVRFVPYSAKEEAEAISIAARKASDLEGMVLISQRSDAVLTRSIVELKDLPQTADGFRSFLHWFNTRGRKLKESSTVRMAAKAYLTWKFGVEPTVHDINSMLRDFGQYVSSYRAGLRRLYSTMEAARDDRTFIWRSPRRDEGVPATGTSSLSETTLYLALPVLPSSQTSVVNAAGRYEPQDWGLISAPFRDSFDAPGSRDVLDVDIASTVGVPFLWTASGQEIGRSYSFLPNAYPFLNKGNLTRGGAELPWLDPFIERLRDWFSTILGARITSAQYRTIGYDLFARFSADEINRALGFDPNAKLITSLFDTSKLLSTSWELLPLSFVVDWFTSSKDVVRQLNLAVLKQVDDLRLRSETGPWLGHRVLHWCTGLGGNWRVTRAWLGTTRGLKARSELRMLNLQDWGEPTIALSPHHMVLPSLVQHSENRGNWGEWNYFGYPGHPSHDRWRNAMSAYGQEAHGPTLPLGGPMTLGTEENEPNPGMIISHVPVMVLRLDSSNETASRPIVCEKGIHYYRCPWPEQDLGWTKFVPSMNCRMTLSKLASLAAMLVQMSPVRGSRRS